MKLILVLLLAAAALGAGDRDFERLVRGIESDYGVRQTRIPFLGFANFFVKVIRPAGVSDLRLAVFEDFSAAGLDQGLASRAGAGWRPFIRVIERHGRETTLIYANTTDKHLKLLVANVEPRDTTFVQLRLNQSAMKRWIEDPTGNSRTHFRRRGPSAPDHDVH